MRVPGRSVRKGNEVIFDRDGSSWAIKTIEDMPVVRVG